MMSEELPIEDVYSLMSQFGLPGSYFTGQRPPAPSGQLGMGYTLVIDLDDMSVITRDSNEEGDLSLAEVLEAVRSAND